MFGGNPFAALSEAGASSVEPEEGPEVDIDVGIGIKTKADASGFVS